MEFGYTADAYRDNSNFQFHSNILSPDITTSQHILSMEVEKVDCIEEKIEDAKPTNEPAYTKREERLLRWKCDVHVVPILFLLFLLAFIDRINIGNARLQGLEADLNMAGHQYNIALFVFFIPYILFEVPSNLILKKVKPSWWISGIMFAWGRTFLFRPSCVLTIKGIITVCQGVTKSFGGLVACRFLLGLFEAGFMPG